VKRLKNTKKLEPTTKHFEATCATRWRQNKIINIMNTFVFKYDIRICPKTTELVDATVNQSLILLNKMNEANIPEQEKRRLCVDFEKILNEIVQVIVNHNIKFEKMTPSATA
jgi:hypothetical protein